jgi:hypothetical protein
VFLLLLFQQTALSQGTAFTYQGKLTDGGIPANNTYDLQFKLLTHEQMFETAEYWRMRATPVVSTLLLFCSSSMPSRNSTIRSRD